MQTLYLIDGPSGAGKSYVCRYFKHNNLVQCLYKYTTRPLRSTESADDTSSDLIHVTPDEFRLLAPDYRFTYGGFQYGIARDAIAAHFKVYDGGLLIIRNPIIINRLIREFHEIQIVPILITASIEKRIERLKLAGFSRDLIEQRLSRDSDLSYFFDRSVCWLTCISNEGDEQALIDEVAGFMGINMHEHEIATPL